MAVAKILAKMAWNNYEIEYDSTKNYDKARQQAEKAIKILSRKLGEDNFCLVEPRFALAAIMTAEARAESSEKKKEKLFAEVEKMERKVEQMCTDALGEFNPCTARMTSNLGSTLKHLKKNTEAEEKLMKALKDLKNINGPLDESVANSYNFLAAFYKNNMKEYTKAEESYEEAIKIRMKLKGPTHSQLQYSYNGLIDTYTKTGDDAKKREYEEKKLEWKKLQNNENEEKKEEEEEEEEEGSKMNFKEIIDFVTKTQDAKKIQGLELT